ncbi:hypothetical protein BT69DRAFT_1271060 [Atractiella rhizophila]|nr:hypothetical protein BT69DRAFT_1271060 [Atractiella rhizophila]
MKLTVLIVIVSCVSAAALPSSYTIPFGPDCGKGVIWEGTPNGTMQTINGVPTYVTINKKPKQDRTALIYLTDVFGLPEVNNKLLADDFSEFFDVYAPDYLRGDPVPLSELNDPNVADFLNVWKLNHTEEVTFPVIENLIDGLKKKGYKRFVSTGYCFGGTSFAAPFLDDPLTPISAGPQAIKLASQNLVSASTTSHPSLLTLPDDFVNLRNSSHAPFQINAIIDDFFNLTSQVMVDQIMEGYTPGYDRNVFIGVPHGFAIRGNMSDPLERAAKETAFVNAVNWLSQNWEA